MKKKILIALLLVISIMLPVQTFNAKTCDEYTTEDTCPNVSCQFKDGTCVSVNVGDDFCEMGGNVTKALRMVGYLLFVAKLFVPIIIVGFATFDLYKSVMEGSTDSLSKQLKAIGFRLIIGILIFFLPTFVNILLTQLGSDKSEYANCQTCLLEPFDCN